MEKSIPMIALYILVMGNTNTDTLIPLLEFLVFNTAQASMEFNTDTTIPFSG